MNSIPNKKSFWGMLITVVLLGTVLGILLLSLRADLLLKIMSVILGVITLLSAIPDLVSGLLSISTRHGAISFGIALITAVLGFVLIFSHETVMLILLGVFLLLLPLLQILFAKDKMRELRRALPQMLIGLVLILVGPAGILNILFDIAGICVLILTAIYALGMLLSLRRSHHKTGGRIFVDSDSDGSIDTVYIDTTGDGKADASVAYRENRK